MTNHLNQFAKTSNYRDPGPQLQASLKADARNNVLKMLAAGLGLGAAARGGVGLMNLARRNQPRPEPTNVFEIQTTDDEEEPYLKAAEGSWIPEFNWKEWLGGANARTPMEIPWFPPAAMAAGLGGAYLGWKGLDKIMDKRRKDEQDDALENAKMQFQQALQGSTQAKYAGDNELGRELDSLFDEVKVAMDHVEPGKLEKAADGIPGGRTLGTLAGLYGIYALLSGGAMGRAAYSRAKKKTAPEVLGAAVKRRKRMRAAAKPTPAYAAMPPAKKKDDEDKRDLTSVVPADNGLLGFDSV